MTGIASTRRGARVIAAAVAVAVVAVPVLAPRSIAASARSSVMHVMDAATAPLLVGIPYDSAERLLNMLLFVPLGMVVVLVVSRRAWPVAPLVCCALSVAVECAQQLIPGRVPDLDDVLWNTTGGAIGALIVVLSRLVSAAVVRASQRGRSTRT